MLSKKHNVSPILIIFFNFILIIISSGQEQWCQGFYIYSIVTPKTGVNLRAEANLESRILLKIPFNEKVESCPFIYSDTFEIDGFKGVWISCRFHGKTGYVFSSFLEISKCWIASEPIIYFPVDHDVRFMDQGAIITCDAYYGIFQDRMQSDFFEIKQIDFADTVRDHTLFYHGRLKEDVDPIFILTGFKLSEKRIRGKALEKMFYPGEKQITYIDGENNHYGFFAKGKPMESNNRDIFKAIENYEVWITMYKHDSLIQKQLIWNASLRSSSYYSYRDQALIKWMGDLNNDGVPEVIIKISTNHIGWEYFILLSDPLSNIYKIIKAGGGAGC